MDTDGGGDPEEALTDLAEASRGYHSAVAFSFYGVPAAVFTATCFVLGMVMVVLIETYPSPEVAVLAVLGATLFDRATPDRIADSVRHRLHIEDRIIDPLTAATATMEGLILAMVCLLGLLWGAVVFAISISVGWDLLTGDLFAKVSGVLAASLPFEESIGLVLFMGYLLVLVLSMSVCGIYGILFWLRELQRVPAVIHDDPTGADGRSDADVPESSPTPHEFPAP